MSRLSECAFTTPPNLAPVDTKTDASSWDPALSFRTVSLIVVLVIEVVVVDVDPFVLSCPFIDSSRFIIGDRLLLCIIADSAPTGVGRRITGGNGDDGTKVLSLGAGLVQLGLLTPMLDRGRMDDDETANV